ncbi:hypothetical protein K470DRAFT_257325 [Piedraia hortae CBS 480.64]|uniref:Uncharacterized protein n=1 Tax=Piedraia hortae CBS 480.64 TaxID=1314780 RepID=A0A6A7C0Z7_9PEZI|nr:hypothetical protein K470DRAFT_257325 [Piedraia hortae CBS 480.64]
MPLIGNPPKNLTDQGQPQTQLYKARYPKTPMEKPLLDPLTHHPWSSEADWIQYKGCDLIRLPYQYAAEEVISAGNGVIRFRHLNHFYVTLFKREWLDKVEQLQQHCRCPEDWIRKSGFRPRLGVGYSGLEEHTGDELENDLDDPGLLWWGKDDPPLADAY